MFTITDLRNIAVQIERNGEQAYRKAGEAAKDDELANLLLWMADEEAKHAVWFEKLQADPMDLCEFSQLETMGRALLQNMVENQTFSLDQAQLIQEAEIEAIVLQSQEFEKDTILFYEMLKGFLDDPSVIEHLELIISEEQSHLQKLKDIISADGSWRNLKSGLKTNGSKKVVAP